MLVKTAGATFTGNMYNVFLKNGFIDVTSQVNISDGSGMQRGDVLLNIKNHTAMFIGNNELVHASMNENNQISGVQTGDQTGKEIRVQNYYVYSEDWDCVHRYTGN